MKREVLPSLRARFIPSRLGVPFRLIYVAIAIRIHLFHEILAVAAEAILIDLEAHQVQNVISLPGRNVAQDVHLSGLGLGSWWL